jgi:hypothetical protein
MATTKLTRIGGPLLGHRPLYSRRQKDHDPISWNILEPLLTSSGDERLVLLPNSRFVTVLAYKTGKKIASLVPLMDPEMDSNLTIESACLARHPQDPGLTNKGDGQQDSKERIDQVLLVGCSDGTLREFCLSQVMNPSKLVEGKFCGQYCVSGPCCGPRRVYTLNQENFALKKVVAVDTAQGIIVYSLVETYKGEDFIGQDLYRVRLPTWIEESSDALANIAEVVERLDRIKCKVGRNEKKQMFENTVPFQLLATDREVQKGFMTETDRVIFVIVARIWGFVVHQERISGKDGESRRAPSVSFSVPSPLCAITVSPNGFDIACGYWEGDMRIMSNALPTIQEYGERLQKGEQNLKHPIDSILVQKVHWHAHPVSSLTYQGSDGVEPLLYSGGEESVLVLWQLARGTYRPADTLPRLAKGGIVHILTTGTHATPGILVYCDDNTLQLFQSHNLKQIWKIQGLPSSGNNSEIRSDGKLILMSGLGRASGQLQWFNPKEESVDVQMEVVPYNRVSKTEGEDAPMPQPSIDLVAFSEDMAQMMTVESIPTENYEVGKKHSLKDGSDVGVVTSVKFWAKSPKSSKEPYFLTASMTFPHGERNKVSAIAISRDGENACTVSNDEKAFRVWRQTLEQDEEDINRRRPVWICQYKVTTPSGFSNYETPKKGVCFSSDGSTLCIAYGHMITLWDHRDATLLNSLRHVINEPIEAIEFVNTNTVRDSILSRSFYGVKLQSPYGHRSMKVWSSRLPKDGPAVVSQAQFISGEQIGIAMYFADERKSKILYVNAVTGDLIAGMVIEIPGKIQNMMLAGPLFKRISGFTGSVEVRPNELEPPLRLFVTTASNEMLLLQDKDDKFLLDSSSEKLANTEKNPVPKIHLSFARKRGEVYRPMFGDDNEPPIKRSAVQVFMGDEQDEEVASSELPSLSGNFLRTFLSRNMVKSRNDI